MSATLPAKRVSFFPKWNDPYLNALSGALAKEGWNCDLVDRKELVRALVDAIAGRRVVHMHWYEGLTPRRTRGEGLLAWLYAPLLWLAGKRGRLIWTVHNVTPHEGYAPLVGRSFLDFLAQASSRVLVHFEDTRDVMERLFGIREKVTVTAPASYGREHGPAIPKGEARAKLFGEIGDDVELFVQIGNLRVYKQPITTILAFREGAPASAKLLMAGRCTNATLRESILASAGDDPRITVRFGFQSNEDIVAALCAADWSICPYTAIDNPGAASLSVAYGCPVIAPDFAVVREVTAGHRAMLYSTAGPARSQLAAAIAAAAVANDEIEDSSTPAPVVSRDDQARATIASYTAAIRDAG